MSLYSVFFEEINNDVEEEFEREEIDEHRWASYHDEIFSGGDTDDDIGSSEEADQSVTPAIELVYAADISKKGQRKHKQKNKNQSKGVMEKKRKKREQSKKRILALTQLKMPLAEERTPGQEIERGERKMLSILNFLNFGGEVRHCFHSSLQLIPFVANENQEEISFQSEQQKLESVIDGGLTDFAMTVALGSVYIHGGMDRFGVPNKVTLKFDPVAFSWSIVSTKFNMLSNGHFLGQIGQKLLAFDAYRVYTLNISHDDGDGTSEEKGNWQHFLPSHMENIDRVSHFASVQFNADILVHGGMTRNGEVVSQFFRLEVAETKESLSFKTVAMRSRKKLCPPGRYKHAAIGLDMHIVETIYGLNHRFLTQLPSKVKMNDRLFLIYGGIGESQSYLNDMWVYRIEKEKWAEVDQHGVLPPPMHSFSMWTTTDNNMIYVYGGSYRDIKSDRDVVSDSLYIFEFDALRGDGAPLSGHWKIFELQSPALKQFAMSGHKTILMNGKSAISFGADHGDNDSLKCTVFHGVGNKGIPNETIQWLWECVEKDIDSDILIKTRREILSNGEGTQDTDFMRCHRCVLSARSNKFRQMLTDNNSLSLVSKEPLVLEIDDYDTDVVHAYVKFLYTATVNLSYSRKVQQLVSMSEEYGHYEIMEQICSVGSQVYIDSHAMAMKQLKQDLLSLMDNESLFTDITLACPTDNIDEGLCIAFDTVDDISESRDEHEESTGHTCIIQGHRVILKRIPHIQRCLTSGMEESVTGTIHFEDIGEQALRSILHYMYTGEVKIEMEYVVDLYLASKLFDLVNLHQHAHRTLLDFVSEENALSILSLADAHDDQMLYQRCLQLIANNDRLYKVVKNDPNFDNLGERTRRGLKILYLDREKDRINRKWREDKLIRRRQKYLESSRNLKQS